MQYSPKLKKAAEEIKGILKKYDIGASVVLHTPGNGEYITHIDTSYSCAKIQGDGNLRIQTKGRSHEDITATVNMIQTFEEVSVMLYGNFSSILHELRKHMEIDNDEGYFSGHTDQNN